MGESPNKPNCSSLNPKQQIPFQMICETECIIWIPKIKLNYVFRKLISYLLL